MQKLVKILAFFACVVILIAVNKATVKIQAQPADLSCQSNVAGTLPVTGPACGPQKASDHPDINVKLRGFQKYDGFLGLVRLDGPTDPRAPKLNTLFYDERNPVVTALYSVGVWEGKGAGTIPDGPHMAGFQVLKGENIRVPLSGYDLGCGASAMVLYADSNSITIKYTREDNVISGYTIHVLGINVKSSLLNLYSQMDASGRKNLPVVSVGDTLGQAQGNEIWVIIRDTGSFMDPRSCKDWWPNCNSNIPTEKEKIAPRSLTEFDLSGSYRAPRSPGCDIEQVPRYPALGSLQACPPEFKTRGQGTNQNLPTCVPTQAKASLADPSRGENLCTSSCGDPLTLNETLGLNVYNNCALGTCRASISLDPKTPLTIPMAKNLADYFAGTLDAGAVAAKSITQEQLDKIREAIKNGKSDPLLEEGFRRAGVARKLLPSEIQDQLRCQFINYVKQKKSSGENTKYIFKQNGQATEFQVDGLNVTAIQIPPTLDPRNCSKVLPIPDKSSWTKTPSGKVWPDVPLFDNENSQGKIEFVSGGVYTPQLNPIQTSIPEIRRLYLATNVLQKALVPEKVLGQKAPTPGDLKMTIGPEIQPKLDYLAACTPTPTLNNIYTNSEDYKKAVQCDWSNLPTGEEESPVCTVGPDGQINCFQQVSSSQVSSNRVGYFPTVVVQTRNVTPYLYDTYLQTIDKSRGLLRIFEPVAAQQDKEAQFEKAFKPLPAASNQIKYQLAFEQGVSLQSKPGGWKLLFDKLGGIWTAKEFVLRLLNPKNSATSP